MLDLGCSNMCANLSRAIPEHPLTGILFCHLAWECQSSQPIGDHLLWPRPFPSTKSFCAPLFFCILRLISLYCISSHTVYAIPEWCCLKARLNDRRNAIYHRHIAMKPRTSKDTKNSPSHNAEVKLSLCETGQF